MTIKNNQSGTGMPFATGVACAACAVASLLVTAAAHAQTIYRATGTTGNVTFTDKVPANAVKATPLGTEAAAPPVIGSPLPFALRQSAARYPVTLYTSANCAPCDAGRALLSKRGIPFTEMTINSAADGEALRRISNTSSLPLLTIGSQHVKGFSDLEWTQYLDAAEYPPTSALPPGYVRPQPAPLVAQPKAPAEKTDDAQAQLKALPPVQPPNDPVSNPAGIRF